MADILGDLEDLDNALFGGRTSTQRPAGGRSTVESLFGSSQPSSSAAASSADRPRSQRPTVSFNLDPTPPSRSTNLEDLFADPAPAPTRAPAQPRPARSRPTTGSLSGLFGGSSSQSDHETTIAPAPAAPPPAAVPAPSAGGTRQEDTGRIRRLEEEIERLNREIDELKRKKKGDEEELENQWKNRLLKKETDLKEEFSDERASLQRQISKLKEEHEEEVQRLKTTHARQIETLQTTTGQTTDITSMVDKVDHLQSTLGKLTSDMLATSERSFNDRELSLKLREQTLEMREERMREEREQLQEEKRKVYELNAKLDDLCKGNQSVMEQDKWRIRDEWARLNAEKQVFKEDQKYVMDTLEKQKEALDKAKTTFMREQHDLVVRVSTERASLEQEKNDFFTRRNMDVRRLKEEAADLQHKLDSVEVAEHEVYEMKRHFEAKLNELQELEASLMDECIELEKIRDSIRNAPPPEIFTVLPQELSSRRTKRPNSRRQSHMGELDDMKRNESVRTVLKNHSEFLEKYTGQKVAAVAPSIGLNKRDFLN